MADRPQPELRKRAPLPLAPTASADLRLDLARALLRLLGTGAIAPGSRVADLCAAVGVEVTDLDRARRIEATARPRRAARAQ